MSLTYRGPDAYFGPEPVLLVVVDTEEEFDWDRPFDRENRDVDTILANERVQEIYDRFGIQPTYCIDQCIAEDQAAVEFLSRLVKQNRCQIGTHLHPWVTLPYDEDVNDVNSYHGNLPVTLERAKIKSATDTIERAFGERPRIFKAGRSGIGPNTIELLRDSGYVIDCSFVPHTSFRADGGPSFIGLQDQPFWMDEARTFLEVPLTKGFSGMMAGMFPPSLAGMFDAEWATRLRVMGILSRLNLIERATLSPEGITAAEQIRLIRSMLARGKKVFSLTYHSPSLVPGHTPYVRSEEDLQEFLYRIERVLTVFRDDIGGTFTTLDEVRKKALINSG
jgi:hypothetical protein